MQKAHAEGSRSTRWEQKSCFPVTYETEVVLDDFPRKVHELLVVPDARVAYVPIFGVYLSEQRFKDEVYWSMSRGLYSSPRQS